MKKVYVCSPYAGDIENNVKNAKAYCRIEILKGNLPIAPHLMYPLILDDDNPAEREIGLRIGLELLKECDSLHVYGEVISQGMEKEIACWREMGKTEKRFDINVVVTEKEADHGYKTS